MSDSTLHMEFGFQKSGWKEQSGKGINDTT